MQLDGKAGSFLQRPNQLICLLGNKKTGHILDTQGIRTHILHALCQIRPVIQRVGVAQRVGKRYLGMAFLLVTCRHCGLQVAQIVQAVKDSNDIDTIGDGLLYEIFHHVIRVRTITKNVLSAEQHLQLCVLEAVSQLSQPLPGIFLQEAKAGIKGRASPALHSVESHLVHFINDRKHLLCRHSRRDQRLMRVSQYGLRNF